MNIHEFQAKTILKEYGISIPPFSVIDSLDQVNEVIEQMQLQEAVLKVQVHAGGRGKAGGVKLAKNKEEIRSYAKELLGMKIINNQTGPEGVIAHKVLIGPSVSIEKEYYVGAVIDRKKAQAMLILSPEGGMDIEEVAKKTPEKILTIPISLQGTLRSYHLLRIVKFMGWEGKLAEEGRQIVQALAKVFMEKDASLLEINPLVKTKEGHLVALDAKLSVDDNALFRQKQIASFFDPTQISPIEAQAKKYGLEYISLDGNIGCMVNGAGLAMATMDIIKYYGASPANFLDVGGSATQEKVSEGFKLILKDPKVKAILVNIFGGIMNCVTIAGGIIAAVGELKLPCPLVVRMEGTNVENGKKMLKDSGLNIITADSLAEAAKEVVAQSKECC